MNTDLPTPVDVRLMHGTAQLLLLAFVGMGLVTLVRWVVQWPLLDVRAITVRGDVSHNNVHTLRAHVTPRLSGTFLSMDLAQVRQAFEAVPWVRRAVVRRVFPNRLAVTLQEHQALAYWGQESEPRLLNVHGEVFEANVGELDSESLPRLSGPDRSAPEVLAMYRALVPELKPLASGLEQLELSEKGSWRVRLDNGASLELGRGDSAEILARVQRFVHTLTQVSARYGRGHGALESADLRHSNGYALRLRGVSTLSASTPKNKH